MEARPAPPVAPAAEPAINGARTLDFGQADTPPIRTLVALCEDTTLLEAAELAAVGTATVVSCPSADRFIDQLLATGAELALIDAAAAPAPLYGFIVSLLEQFPRLLLLLAGPAQLQHQFSARLADGTVFRFAHKPASAARLKLFIEAASRRLQSIDEPPALHAGGPAPAAGFVNAGAPPARSRLMLWIIASVMAAGIGALTLSRLHWREPAARQALAASSLDAPVAVGAPKATPAIVPEHAAVAPHAAVPAQAVAPEPDRLEVEKAREAELQQQVQRTAIGARVDQAQVYVRLARKRLATGALLAPSDDSARTYVAAAVALAPEDAEVHAVSTALGDALSAAFTGAIAAGDTAAAKLWLQACSEHDAASPMLNRFKLQLDALESSQRAQAEQLAGVQRDLGQLPTEAQARVAPDLNGAQPSVRNALETAAAGDESSASDVVPEGRLQRQRFVQPTYPPAALAGGVTGFVELQFTVDASGKVSDIQVQAAEPRGVFERAAISALSQSRYHPVLRDGVPITQRAQIRLRFAQ